MEENVEKTYTDPITGKFTENNPGGGRPLGQKNYATLYKEALVKIAKLNGREPDDIEMDIINRGLEQARKGNFLFYKDILDRLHGKPMQNIKADVSLRNISTVLDDLENE